MPVSTRAPKITVPAQQGAIEAQPVEAAVSNAPQSTTEESGGRTVAQEVDRLTSGQALKLICRVLHRADPQDLDEATSILEGIRDVIQGTGLSAALV